MSSIAMLVKFLADGLLKLKVRHSDNLNAIAECTYWRMRKQGMKRIMLLPKSPHIYGGSLFLAPIHRHQSQHFIGSEIFANGVEFNVTVKCTYDVMIHCDFFLIIFAIEQMRHITKR